MKMVGNELSDEKREYFRIDDEVILCYSVLAEDADMNKNTKAEQQSINRLTLKARFDSLSREMQPIHRRVIDSCSPEVAQYLSKVDTKLNMLSEHFVENEINAQQMQEHSVNIGAGGMSFTTTEAIAVDTMIELRLILLPENSGVFTYAKTISCDSVGIGSYNIGVQFEGMDVDIQDQISRHVLQRERENINSER